MSVMVPSPLPPPVSAAHTFPVDSEESISFCNAFATHAIQLSRRMVALSLASQQAPEHSIENAVPSVTEKPLVSNIPVPSLLVPSDAPRTNSIYRHGDQSSVLHPPLSAETSFQHQQVRTALDVPLLVQQIAHGVFNPAELFTVLGQVIKSHCAPMRDAAVEEMIATAREASTTVATSGETPHRNHLEKTVLAIRQCFDLFELMKLVSNVSRISFEPLHIVHFFLTSVSSVVVVVFVDVF